MKVQDTHYRTIWLEDNAVKMIYQPALPHHFEIRTLQSYEEVAVSIEDMWVRGAPAIGAAGAFGMVMAILEAPSDNFIDFVQNAAKRLRSTRPTAQNLFFGIDHILKAISSETKLESAQKAATQAAQNLANGEISACEEIGKAGSQLIKDGMNLLTHCNAGWLACVDWGTALAPMYMAKREGKKNFVFVDETRPRGQGARLTAWELGHEHIDHAVIADNAAGFYMARGDIHMVIVGADRIAFNGDAANKIGTFTKAVVAKACRIPFYVAAPVSTIDFNCPTGKEIPIEERSADEVHYTWGATEQGDFVKVRTTPKTSSAKNPAFDVTPAEYIAGIITEKGVFPPDQLHQLQP